MSRNKISVEVLKAVVADQNISFYTKDVSEDSRVRSAHLGLEKKRNYHAYVGGALSDHRSILGIEEIQKSTSRGSLWQKKGQVQT